VHDLCEHDLCVRARAAPLSSSHQCLYDCDAQGVLTNPKAGRSSLHGEPLWALANICKNHKTYLDDTQIERALGLDGTAPGILAVARCVSLHLSRTRHTDYIPPGVAGS